MKKNLYLLPLVLFPFFVSGQELITASTEPVLFYKEINLSLSNDKPKQALQDFERLVAFYESEGRQKELPESFFGMALILALNGHYPESIKYHKKAIRLHKKYQAGEPTEMFINLGLTYELAGKNRKAKRLLGGRNFNS